MRDRARAVVIGGGVGGASILYWLTKLGWDDVLLVERADLTSGSTFHSAGLVGQLRGSLSLTRMMMDSVDLYRTLADEVGLETGWHEVGSLRLASSQERMEELARQAGWAKTFGLPLELVSAEEAQRLFPPMSTEGVLGAAYLPTDGYIDPSQLTFALAEGARRGGAEIATHTRVTAVGVERGRITGVETDKGSVEADVVVNAGGMFAGEIGRLAGVNVPVIPMAHEYLITKPSGVPLDVPTMRDPSLLVYFRGESGGLVMGGYERNPAPWGLDWDRARLQRAAPRGGLGALRGADDERDRPRARARGGRGREARQRSRGLYPGRRVHPRRVGRARLLGRGRLLRARTRRRGRHGEARGRVDRRGRPEPGRLGDGLPALRRRLSEPGLHARPHRGGLLDVLRRQVPGPRAGGGPAPAGLTGLRAAAGAGRGLRREVRLGARELVRAQRRARGRVAAAARLGGAALVARDRGGAPRLPRGRRPLRRDVLRQARRRRAGRGRIPRVAVRQPRRPRCRRRHLHADAEPARRHRVRLHRDAAGGGALPHRHGHGLRPARRGLDPRARAGRRLRARRGRHLALRLPRPLGSGRARAAAAAHRTTTWGTKRSRTCERGSSASAPSPAWPCA